MNKTLLTTVIILAVAGTATAQNGMYVPFNPGVTQASFDVQAAPTAAPETALAPSPAISPSISPSPSIAPSPGAESGGVGFLNYFNSPSCDDGQAAMDAYCMSKKSRPLTFDYRIRSFFNAHTGYEFGLPETETPNWKPLSRLDFPLNSFWHGLEMGSEWENFEIHVEWLTPMQSRINGDMHDYDWQEPVADYSDLGIVKERWKESHMVDLKINFKLWDQLSWFPMEFWPTGGFRWQRFNIMTFDLHQVKSNGIWTLNDGYYGDCIDFCQDYYVTYIGGQLRKNWQWGNLPPVRFTLQADWGYTDSFNVDHHLLREGDRYTKESTWGDTFHYGITSEFMLRRNFSFGISADYQQTSTVGKHHFINEPLGVDEEWKNGVRVWSDQASLTMFFRLDI